MTPTVLTLTEGWERRPAGATAIAAGPPSSSLWAGIPGLTVPGAVRYSEPKTITSAFSRSASSVRPTLVPALTTTWRGMSGAPTEAAPRASSSSASFSSSAPPWEWRT